MNRFLKIAYDAGAAKAEEDFAGGSPILGLLPKEDAAYLQSLAEPPPPPTQLTVEEIQQLGQIARVAGKSKNPLIQLAGRVAPRAAEALTKEEPHGPPETRV